MGPPRNTIFLLFAFLLLLRLPISTAQKPTPEPNPTPPTEEEEEGLKPKKKLTPEEACKGVFLRYDIQSWEKIYPILKNGSEDQPFAFEGVATILNADDKPVEKWSLKIGYANRTVLVSSTDSILTNGSAYPYIVTGDEGVNFTGSPSSDLKTAIETAGNLDFIQAKLTIVGTQFGTSPPARKLPSTIKLNNPEYLCPEPISPRLKLLPDAEPTTMHTCCTLDPLFDDTALSTKFYDRKTGDLTIDYDVVQTYESSYLAVVKINNTHPLARLDNWRLSWQWTRDEFVFKTQGALTTAVDSSGCLHGPQGEFYQKLDLNTVQNCQRTPTFLDLPKHMFNDTKIGRIPFCCRNGSILPAAMDPDKTMSSFQLQVFKMPPDLDKITLYPPQQFAINGSDGAQNQTYVCGEPIRVRPTIKADPAGLPTTNVAVASWQVVCNITQPKKAKNKCCVSFSGFYNDSVVPCNTCACGCPDKITQTCSPTTPSLLLPPESLLVPFDNRTTKALEWAAINHLHVPDPLPCADNCRISINWHVLTDFKGGWSARVTLMNWGDMDFADWYGAVVLPKPFDGFEKAYSFNSTTIGDDTIFFQGLPGLNYLVRMNDTVDPMNPGKVQSVLSFTKKNLTTKINITQGDGFPTRVYFNGEECSIPTILPIDGVGRQATLSGGSLLATSLIVLAVSLLLLAEPKI